MSDQNGHAVDLPAVSEPAALAARPSSRSRIHVAVVALSVLATLTVPAPLAHAAFPGTNGKIVFIKDLPPGNREVFTMNPDGTDQRNLTNRLGDERRPTFSADGNKIAFQSLRDGNWEIYTMNADGTGQTNVSKSPDTEDYFPVFSPDGTKIAFAKFKDGRFDIYTMSSDGTGQTNLTNDVAADFYPGWSPDGKRIVFMHNPHSPDASERAGNWEIYTANPDGSGLTNLTNHPAGDLHPAFSPDGSKVAFESERDGNVEAYTMNADGTGPRNLSNHPARDLRPGYSPDGTKLVFDTDRERNPDTGEPQREIYTMNANGTGQANISRSPTINDILPDWGPLARPAAPPPPPVARPTRVRAANVPRGCASRRFRVRVRISAASAQIVTVFLDGKRIARSARTLFSVGVRVRGLRRGRHRLTVVAADPAGNRTRRTFRFRACPARAPRFAG